MFSHQVTLFRSISTLCGYYPWKAHLLTVIHEELTQCRSEEYLICSNPGMDCQQSIVNLYRYDVRVAIRFFIVVLFE